MVISCMSKGGVVEIPNYSLGQWTVKEWRSVVKKNFPGYSARKNGRELIVERHD
jgi:hypothetical protein